MNKVYVDKARLLRRVIIISWISLGICFLVKIFGGNFFEIMCGNPIYKQVCDYADTHFWLKYFIGVSSSLFCQSFYSLAILQKYKFTKSQCIITLVSILISCFLKYFNEIIGGIFDIWIFFVLPMIFLQKEFKKKWWQVPIAYLITFSFQLLSLLVRNLGIVNIGETYFIGLIYSIDVYIMCVLYYLYRNYQKEKKEMGILWGIFMGKPVDKLKKMKAVREAKRDKIDAEIKAIETEIERQNKENK